MNKQLFWLDPANETSSFCEYVNKSGDVININQFGSQIEVFKSELFEIIEDESTSQPLYFQNVIDKKYILKILDFDIMEETEGEICLSEIYTVFIKNNQPYVILYDYKTCELKDVLWEALKTKTFRIH